MNPEHRIIHDMPAEERAKLDALLANLATDVPRSELVMAWLCYRLVRSLNGNQLQMPTRWGMAGAELDRLVQESVIEALVVKVLEIQAAKKENETTRIETPQGKG